MLAANGVQEGVGGVSGLAGHWRRAWRPEPGSPLRAKLVLGKDCSRRLRVEESSCQ